MSARRSTSLRTGLRAALDGLAPHRRGRIPFVAQLEVADCGAACLTMVLRQHGCHVELREVRERLGNGAAGTSADAMISAAAGYGLRGRGVSLEVEGLRHLRAGSILHWGFRHFVVLERSSERYVHVLDPALGRRRIAMAQFRRSFTGVALTFELADAFERTPSGRSRLRGYFAQLLAQRGLIARVISLSVVLRLFALALPLLTSVVVDGIVPRADLDLLWVVVLGLGVTLCFQFTAGLARAHLLLQLRTNLDTKLTLGFLDHLVSLPCSYFQRRSAGDLMTRLGSNATIRQVLASSTMSALLDGTFAVVYLALVFVIHPALGWVTLGLGAAQTLVFVGGRRSVTQLVRESLEAGARTQGELVQVLAGIETLKLGGAERRAVERWARLFVDGLNISLRQGHLAALLSGINGVLWSAAPLCVLVVGALAVVGGEMTLGTMLAVNALAIGFLAPLSTLVTTALSVQELAGHLERIDDVLAESPEQVGPARATPELTGHVRLVDVSFRYNPTGAAVLRGVDLTVEAGTLLAITGRSGSGKTTLANLLLGLHRPSQGRVMYDGVDLDDIDHARLRARVGVVPQYPFIFGRSIRDNVTLGDDSVPLDAVIQAARRAAIHDDIVAMPMGYETIVADGGSSLSGGQRQRLALARALLRRPPLVVLDEATSSVDNATERRMMEALAELDCTRIVIAHRLSTIVHADRIVMLDAGRIVESGTHDELVARRGAYYELVATQRGPSTSEETVYRAHAP